MAKREIEFLLSLDVEKGRKHDHKIVYRTYLLNVGTWVFLLCLPFLKVNTMLIFSWCYIS